MTDDYLCKSCGHRAGDHAGRNLCMAIDCDCRDDPYLEQFDVIQEQLNIANKALDDIDNWYDGHSNFIAHTAKTKIKRLEAKMDEEHTVTDGSQLIIAIEEISNLRKQLTITEKQLRYIEKLGSRNVSK